MKHNFKQLIILVSMALLWHGFTMASQESVSPENLRQNENDSFIDEENKDNLIGFSQKHYQVNESNLSVTITVERICLDENTISQASVWYSVSYSTATLRDDYDILAEKIHWQKGECGLKNIEIPIIDDSEVEDDETVVITLSNFSGTKLNTQSSTILTIVDNDEIIVGFSQENYRVDKNLQSATILVTQKGCSPSTEPFSVSYASNEEGSAIPGEDYSAVAGTLTWEEGIGDNKYCGPLWFYVPILDNGPIESDKTIHLKLSNPTSGIQLAQSEAILTIIDNAISPTTIPVSEENNPGVISFSQTEYYIDEKTLNHGVLIWVERSGCGTKTPPVSILYTTHYNGSVIAGKDDKTVTDILSWKAGNCSSKWFEMPITDDLDVENETVSLKLSEPTGGVKLVQSEALLTIIDNDGSTIGFSQDNYWVKEEDKLPAITVERTDCVSGFIPPASVSYLVYEGDHLATKGKLSWEINQCIPLTFEVILFDDTQVEDDEIISLELESLSGAKWGKNRAILTVVDNEPFTNQISTAENRTMRITMNLDKKNYALEDVLRLDMTVDGIGKAGLYVAITSPNGDIMTLDYPNKWHQLNTLQPYLSPLNIVGKQVYPIFNGQLPAGQALGKYSVCGILVHPNAIDILNQANWIYWDCPTLIIYDSPPSFRDTLQDGSLGPEMVWIPSGTFRMGNIQNANYFEKKVLVSTVSINRFAMGRYELTVGEFQQFVNTTGYSAATNCSTKDNQHDNEPIVCVSWNDVTVYAEWLSQQTGEQYRLPTQAEWEYAARAGTETKYWWGNKIGTNQANCGTDCNDNFSRVAPVGSFSPNAFGLYDITGNVWEWTCSSYAMQRCLNRDNIDRNDIIFLRGGSWRDNADGMQIAFRNSTGRFHGRSSNTGVRLVRLAK
ncbi:SUMF1/EgtB/PvdO family nonheme iron enzyme [Candidatus Parabeggiatoa sp. HSG14]|uniref:SUMF1/EgtB/PvdO family nonheme iron enzyme n=1 Tax=Candidatus Parabeggiatoa sp. HSG14 TaxID=3055593 RepID=UPI0025A718E5|nr:SUMF1/EgtB/PvdO family nonheme iron enzyme [Thiotrichales bacterium HSG14]